MTGSLAPFFHPQGVAIIGASSSPSKLSFGIFRNLTSYGYSGGIYPVNPKASEILGLTCFPDIASVPDPVDLAVIVLPGQAVPDTLRACAQRGIRAATIISGGFREVGEEGRELEDRCLAIAREAGMRLVGPNCVGTMDLHSGLNTTFIAGVPDKGGIAFLSQSGAVCGGIVDIVRGKKIGFANFVSLGNEADVTEADVIEYLATDPNTRVITAYVEAIRDGRRFLEVASRVSREKPIVLLKAGKTNAGARAVSSHTGSIAGSHAAYQAAFRQAGVIEVDTVADLFDVAFALEKQPVPAGIQTAIVTNSGGPAALASDSLANHGLALAQLSESTKATMRSHLNPSAQVSNPVDMLGGAEPADYEMALREVARDPQVDLILPILVPQALINPVEVANAIVRATQGAAKPVLACFMGDEMVVAARNVLHDHGIPLYTYPDVMGRVLGAMTRYGQWLASPVFSPADPTESSQKAPVRVDYPAGSVLGEHETRPILEQSGIHVAEGGFAAGAEAAAALADWLGGPVVMKIVSPQILHKSDVGGIRINLANGEAVKQAYEEMMARLAQTAPGADLQGVLVEKMAPKGWEVIVGMRRDPNFGPLLMFGLGGVYVELFHDVAFRVAPVSPEQARAMIAETRAGKLLTGFRGAQNADLDAVVEILCRLGELALANPQISEAEINPLLVLPTGQGAVALDGRILMGEVA